MIHDAHIHTRRRELARTLAVILLCLAMLIVAGVAPAHAARLKDIASFSGVRNNELVGYGLVVGLSGTGDGTTNEFTIRSMTNMLEKMGVSVNPANLKPKNTAAVMVTAKMPASARPGSPLDVTVSSMGDAKSLLGGVLLITPLRGLDGRVYAVAQGSMTLGGYSAEGQAATAQKNITTVGRIPNGATVEREVPFQFNRQDSLTINMANQDFGTTMQVVNRINTAVGGNMAKALDGATIQLAIPAKFQGNLVPLMASLENLDISPDSRARVVVDEKTGTVVLGGYVRLTKVAVAHGNLQIVVAETPNVSQPGAFSGGQTVVTPQSDIKVKEQNNRLLLMEGATLQELVDGLNSVGATPRDLISILRTLKSAGALHADLEVI
ncbi:MAG: flagellar biosynthesis protein FlgA [Desulfovibrio sp.]|nr:flagellar biosynthesis protein FlgA [Desulfovibrio sp.]